MDRLQQFAIALALAVVLPMLVYYGVASFQAPPEWNRYFSHMTPPMVDRTPQGDATTQQQQQEAWQAAQDRYTEARKDFAGTLFAVAIPFGLIFLAAGGFIAWPGMATGFILGGVGTLTMAYWNYWTYLSNPLRFFSLLGAALLLSFIAWHLARRSFGSQKKSP